MSFVTKKEFEDAMKVLERALKNQQLVHGSDSAMVMDSMMFSDPYEAYDSRQISFVSPLQAAKNKLFSVNQAIKKQKDETDKNQRSLEKLELEAQALYATIPKLKE